MWGAKLIQIISEPDKWSSTVLRGVKITLKTVTKSDQIDSPHLDLQHNTHQGLTEKCARTSGFSSSSYPDTRTFVGRWSTQTCVKPRPLKILWNQWLTSYWLTQYSRILLEKSILPKLVKKFPAFTLVHSQEAIIGAYPEPEKFQPSPPILFLEHSF